MRSTIVLQLLPQIFFDEGVHPLIMNQRFFKLLFQAVDWSMDQILNFFAGGVSSVIEAGATDFLN